MTNPTYTIGHSTRSIGEFLALLRENGIQTLVDVRKLPGSRRFPQFNQDALEASLAEAGIDYRRLDGLTGRRLVSRTVPFPVNGWWENRSFHNYADHALSDDFRAALSQLRAWSREQPTAVMCSEAVWWRCHRRLIADNLLAHGDEVRHILGAGHVDAAQLSDGAVVGEDAVITYPR